MADFSDDDLLAELGVSKQQKKAAKHTPSEERTIAGFEDIQRFFETNNRPPQHGDSLDIVERLYAVRLDRLRETPEACALLAQFDLHGLLTVPTGLAPRDLDALNDHDLLAELGPDIAREDDINILKHVSSREERQAAEEIANRTPCRDFKQFKPIFEQAQAELQSGVRETRPFGKDASVEMEDFFILGGQLVYVAGLGEVVKASNGDTDWRLRVIYSNGMESNLLRKSLQRALYRDDVGRRLTQATAGPLFSGIWEKDDVGSGTIYVLRSLSNHPFVAQYRELIHKIGVTAGKVEDRIANAAHDATYLLADVEVVASYRLAKIDRVKLEHLFHRIFAAAQIDLTIPDRFGDPVKPREWFLVPLEAINEAVRHVQDGSIVDLIYDPKVARLVKAR